jgi:D-sedoheptulose 7-phosphate isomerase
MINLIRKELLESQSVFQKFISDEVNLITIETAAVHMINALKSGKKLMSCGNGGSFSDAQHFASELSGKFRGVRPALAAMALTDGGAITCIGNDFGFNQIFKRQLEAHGRDGDVLLCLSTSGNSDNVVTAAEYAKRVGIKVISICGNSGGKLKEYTDVMIDIPHAGDAGKIQEMTIIIIHTLVALIESKQ